MAADEVGSEAGPSDFIRDIVAEDLRTGKHERPVTRFPPEPNGFLHVGHVKAIATGFGIAAEYGGRCHLRFDDTNPSAEDAKYAEGMIEDIHWLGFDWGEHLYHTSDYFDRLYEFARELIQKGLAYVCDLSSEEHFATRGTLTEPGSNSPYRERSAEENLDLFARMKEGEFEPGARVLRAKIDMASPVLPMRDPILYRIIKATHHRTGDRWSIYPMYDFAHCLSDAIEHITHSLCSIEFVDHRPLYDWIIENVDAPSTPRQIEFARLELGHTVTSKRMLRRLVEEGRVSGWDDPRMPTIRGMRRRGYPARALRDFVTAVGTTRRENLIPLSRLEFHVRDVLNRSAPRAMGVLDPVKVVIENYPEGEVEELDAINNPEDESAGTRKVPFSRELYIERSDFMEDPPRKFFRLGPGREVRLRYAYFITCTDVVKDAKGEVVELRCTYDPATRGGDAPDGRKVKGTLHWVSAAHSIPAEVRLFEPLFTIDDPKHIDSDQDFVQYVNADSCTAMTQARLEPGLASFEPGAVLQLERQGYFCVDSDSSDGRIVLNRTATLRDTWAKIQKQGA